MVLLLQPSFIWGWVMVVVVVVMMGEARKRLTPFLTCWLRIELREYKGKEGVLWWLLLLWLWLFLL